MASNSQVEFAELIARVSRALVARGLRFMVVGGQAVLLHGEPRLTQDVDITLAASIDALAEVIAALADAGLEPLPKDVRAFVAETFVLPASDATLGARVDLIFSNTAFELEAVNRAVFVELGSESVPFASAEDLLLLKLFAGRPRDLEDAAGIVRRQGDRLNWAYVRNWAAAFAAVEGCEDLPEQVDRLKNGQRP